MLATSSQKLVESGLARRLTVPGLFTMRPPRTLPYAKAEIRGVSCTSVCSGVSRCGGRPLRALGLPEGLPRSATDGLCRNFHIVTSPSRKQKNCRAVQAVC